MKQTILTIGFICLSITLLTTTTYSQFPEDALRLSFPGMGIGARSLGMGMAYTSVANDYSATYWNPAGLGQAKMNEVSLGLSHLSYGNTSTFLNNNQSFTNSATSVNSLGMVYPFPTRRGSLVFAIGYGREANLTTGLSFKGFNAQSSIIPSLDSDLAYELYLIDAQGNTPLVDSMEQSGKVLEGGGVNHWTVAGAIEAAPNLFLGVALNFISGSYSYNRTYLESDIYNKYNVARFGADYAFTDLALSDVIDADLSGFTAKFGLLYRFRNNMQIGIGVKTPSYYTIRENYSQDGASTFDVPDSSGRYSYGYQIDATGEYDIASPFVFSAGVSVPVQDLLLAADIEFIDYTQMEFRNASQRLLNMNTDIKELFRPVTNFHIGGEYAFTDLGLQLRGGFAYLPSPYDGDPESFARKYITGGVGFLVEDVILIDLGYAHGSWETFRYNYTTAPKTSEKVDTNNLIATVTYRF
jgi:long-subunit fatty acid transport protein